jgi:hypothetical protein
MQVKGVFKGTEGKSTENPAAKKFAADPANRHGNEQGNTKAMNGSPCGDEKKYPID